MFRGRGRGAMRGGLRVPPGAAPLPPTSRHAGPVGGGAPLSGTPGQPGQATTMRKVVSPLTTSQDAVSPLPMPMPLAPRFGDGKHRPNDEEVPSPRPLNPIPLKPPDRSRQVDRSHPQSSLPPREARPLGDEPVAKRHKVDRIVEDRRGRGESNGIKSALNMTEPLAQGDEKSPNAVHDECAAGSPLKLAFVPPNDISDDAADGMFYLEKEPMTSGQQRLLLRECIVDLLMLHGKTCVDGRRYIPHGELVFNFFDEIELRSGIKLRDLLSKDEVSQKNLQELSGISIEEIDGSCVTYRPTSLDATNRLRCSLKYWEATPAQVELARAVVSHIKRVTGMEVVPLGAFAAGMASRDDTTLKVALVNDDVVSSRLQLICAAEANDWTVVRVSTDYYSSSTADVKRLAILYEDPVPRYLQLRIPHLDLEVELHFMTGYDVNPELQRLKSEVDNAEPEMLLLAKAVRRLILQPCRSNEVDAAHISLLLVRSFYVSMSYRGMGLYQDYIDLLVFFAEEEEIGEAIREWSCLGESLGDELLRGTFWLTTSRSYQYWQRASEVGSRPSSSSQIPLAFRGWKD